MSLNSGTEGSPERTVHCTFHSRVDSLFPAKFKNADDDDNVHDKLVNFFLDLKLSLRSEALLTKSSIMTMFFFFPHLNSRRNSETICEDIVATSS